MADHDTAGMDATEIPAADHREMLDPIGRIEGTADPQARRELADTAIAEVVRHAVAEEVHVHPAIEEDVPHGREEVRRGKEEHQEIVGTMTAMEATEPSDPRFMDEVRHIEAMIRGHARSEQGEQFPRLRRHVPRDRLPGMGRKVGAAKALAPTRPHPSAPRSALLRRTVGPGAGLVDRLLDRLRGRRAG